MNTLSGKTLISHLSDLVKMSFIAAISDCDQLRLSGLAMLQVRAGVLVGLVGV